MGSVTEARTPKTISEFDSERQDLLSQVDLMRTEIIIFDEFWISASYWRNGRLRNRKLLQISAHQ